MAEIYDNIEKKFLDGLQSIIKPITVKRVDFCVGYFNLRGWNNIADDIDKLTGCVTNDEIEDEQNIQKFRTCRLLIGMYKSPETLLSEQYGLKTKDLFNDDGEYNIDPDKAKAARETIAREFREQLLLGNPDKSSEKALKQLHEQLKNGKVCIKLYLKNQLHAKVYIAHRTDDSIKSQVIMGSSNLTYSGFNSNGELNVQFDDSTHSAILYRWFLDRWNDKWCLDITQDLIEVLEESWIIDNKPYYIYMKAIYHLSRDGRMGDKLKIPNEIGKTLLDFQKIAVRLATQHLIERDGVMIGDVVGLGKTIMACTIAKIYEIERLTNSLILCPANLKEMWESQIKKYNINAKVHSIDKEFDDDDSNYGLIIIDESHNLRNVESKRYKRIYDFVHKPYQRYNNEHNQRPKLLLLTATPYNKTYIDISNQIKLFIDEEKSLGIQPEKYIQSLQEGAKSGEQAFIEKHPGINIQSIRAFELSHDPEDWITLMRLFLVRRTRTFIKNNYAKYDEKENRKYLVLSDGKKSYFPERIAHTQHYQVEENSQYAKLYSKQMLDLLEQLKMPRYTLISYIDKNIAIKDEKAKKVIDNLSRAGKQLMGFSISTLYKRLESSGYAFLLTLKRHIIRNEVYLYAIDTNQPLPIGNNASIDAYLDVTNGDEDGEVNGNFVSIKTAITQSDFKTVAIQYYKQIKDSNKFKWLDTKYLSRNDSNEITLKADLNIDNDNMLQMLELCGNWKPENDPKINELYTLIENNYKFDKILVFTQYADTAEYLYEELKSRNISDIEYVTGNSKNITDAVNRFAPFCNEFDVTKARNGELRVLITTDVLSEGQNLQDAHVIINFDLPWAIIRLIQRAGRVDRIGQKSKNIDCYSFFPADGIESIIKLHKRLNTRLNEYTQVMGNDELFFEDDETNLRDLYNGKDKIIDDDESDNDVDTTSLATHIWNAATKANPDLLKIIPKIQDISISTKRSSGNGNGNSVIAYIRKPNNEYGEIIWRNENGIITREPNRIIKAMECGINEPRLKRLPNHHEIVLQCLDEIAKRENNLTGRTQIKRYITELLISETSQPIDLFKYKKERQKKLKSILSLLMGEVLLKKSFEDTIKQMRKDNESDFEIANKIAELYDSNDIFIERLPHTLTDPCIICSMGLSEE